MFGLTSNSTYSEKSEAYSDFRQNYCGTCKTIGKVYGNKERMFLNHDVVFLSELLSAISADNEKFSQISVFKCTNLPKDISKIPDFLKYCASVNILLACYKIQDNIIDAKHKLNIWRSIIFFETRKFQKAQEILGNFGLNFQFIEQNLKEQFKKEIVHNSFKNSVDCIQYYANATRKITGEVFRSSLHTVGKIELTNEFSKIGESLGELVYILDAIVDYKNDIKKNRFNPFYTLTNKSKELPLDLLNEVVNYIYKRLNTIENTIISLPILEEKKKLFISRLYLNVRLGLGNTNKVCNTCKSSVVIPPVKERINDAIKVAKANVAINSALLRILKYPLIASILILVFVLSPHFAYSSDFLVNDKPKGCGEGSSFCECCENTFCGFCDTLQPDCQNDCCCFRVVPCKCVGVPCCAVPFIFSMFKSGCNDCGNRGGDTIHINVPKDSPHIKIHRN